MAIDDARATNGPFPEAENDEILFKFESESS